MVSYGTSVTIGTAATYTFNRALFNAAGADLWENIVQGSRTGYANEGGELRSRAYNGSRVAFRCQSNVAGDGTTQSTFEVTKSDNTLLFGVDASGNVTITGSIAGAGGFSAYTDLAVAANVLQGTPHLQYRSEPGGITRLNGQYVIDTAGVTAGTALNGTALPAALRPPANGAAYTVRFTGTGAAAAVFTMSSAGILTCSANLVSGNTFNLDGFTFAHV